MEVLKRLFRVKLCWMKARGQCISYWDVCNFQGNRVCFVIVFGVFHIRIFAIFIKKRYWLIKMRCREVILKGAAKQEWKGIGAAVSSAPSLFFGFAKQNLRAIGRMVNATLNGFASVVKQYLRLIKTQHFLSPCAQKTVSVSQLSLHNCPFIFLLLALCASLFPFHSLLFPFLILYFFNFQLPLFLIF